MNIGAGLEDTTFYRVDNGLIHWYDLDLPAVIDIRRQLLPEPDRVMYIAKSLLDPSWCKDVNTENGIFMIAGGIFMWFEEAQVKQVLRHSQTTSLTVKLYLMPCQDQTMTLVVHGLTGCRRNNGIR